MKAKVYISGPITIGDREHNFKQAADAHTALLLSGFAPLNPMLSMKLPGCWDIPHGTWVDADLPWVSCADALLRLPGESVGADREVALAKSLGIPIYYEMEALLCRS